MAVLSAWVNRRDRVEARKRQCRSGVNARDVVARDAETPFWSTESRRKRQKGVPDTARCHGWGLAAGTEALDQIEPDGVAQKSRGLLCAPGPLMSGRYREVAPHCFCGIQEKTGSGCEKSR